MTPGEEPAKDPKEKSMTTDTLPKFDIRREGRAWTREEMKQRLDELGEVKLEIIHGKLLWSREERLLLIGMLLEHAGMDDVVALGDAARWKEAIDARLAKEQQR